ncbi:DUF3823 domain-containing protein [Pedobacter sp. L105]|uniref:DUF3823 domain-containing protein n=1 Tax=Pedobacter sp. L105 TaxID=1641871 RepID=UPI00131B38EA|nr:DUF3823 domain-containing protein [Pedobacter sp. L105]
MKQLFYYIFLSILLCTAYSCKKDNYDAPNATLNGAVTDAATGQTVQTEIGSGGTRIKLLEISWSATPTPYYIFSMQDGTYNNTKIFASTNKITAEGAFVPMVQTDAAGNTTIDQTQTVTIKGKGTATVNFSVEPFLRIDWIGTPVYNADGTITAQFKITRGTANPAFQLNISDVFLFVSSTRYLGNNDYDNRYSNHVTYDGASGNNIIGQTLTYTTTGGALPTKRDWFLRIGARVAYGLNYYNYTDVKTVTVP